MIDFFFGEAKQVKPIDEKVLRSIHRQSEQRWLLEYVHPLHIQKFTAKSIRDKYESEETNQPVYYLGRTLDPVADAARLQKWLKAVAPGKTNADMSEWFENSLDLLLNRDRNNPDTVQDVPKNLPPHLIPTFGTFVPLDKRMLAPGHRYKIERIMCVIAYNNPTLSTYCPYLVELAQLLLVFAHDYQVAFMLHSMIGTTAQNTMWYFPTAPEHTVRDAMSFDIALKKRAPDLCDLFFCHGIQPRRLFASVFRRLYVSFFTVETVYRILDPYLHPETGGSALLVSFFVAFLKINAPVLLRATSGEILLQNIFKLARLDDFDAIYQTATTSCNVTHAKLMKMNAQHTLPPSSCSTPMQSFRFPRFRNSTSNILTYDLMIILWSWLPRKLSLQNPHRIFSAQRDGFSLSRLLYTFKEHCHRRSTATKGKQAAQGQPHLLVIQTTDQQVFGVFASRNWSEIHAAPLCDPEAFIFSLLPTFKRYSMATAIAERAKARELSTSVSATTPTPSLSNNLANASGNASSKPLNSPGHVRSQSSSFASVPTSAAGDLNGLGAKRPPSIVEEPSSAVSQTTPTSTLSPSVPSSLSASSFPDVTPVSPSNTTLSSASSSSNSAASSSSSSMSHTAASVSGVPTPILDRAFSADPQLHLITTASDAAPHASQQSLSPQQGVASPHTQSPLQPPQSMLTLQLPNDLQRTASGPQQQQQAAAARRRSSLTPVSGASPRSARPPSLLADIPTSGRDTREAGPLLNIMPSGLYFGDSGATALFLDNALNKGRTESCSLLNSPSLAGSGAGDTSNGNTTGTKRPTANLPSTSQVSRQLLSVEPSQFPTRSVTSLELTSELPTRSSTSLNLAPQSSAARKSTLQRFLSPAKKIVPKFLQAPSAAGGAAAAAAGAGPVPTPTPTPSPPQPVYQLAAPSVINSPLSLARSRSNTSSAPESGDECFGHQFTILDVELFVFTIDSEHE